MKEYVWLAEEVRKSGQIVNGLRDKIVLIISENMSSIPGLVNTGIRISRIARNIERIADPSANISENVLHTLIH